VFCPNCGTQNPDAAQTCSKCNFHLKSAAAPKFKGTMLMMNQPGAPPAGPPAAPGSGATATRPAPGGLPPPGAGAVPTKLKGTMVGVAPMAIGGAPFPPPGTQPMAATPPLSPLPPPVAASGEAASAFSPPVPQPGVNPLGGTVAADAGIFGAFAAHQHQRQVPSVGGPPPHGAPPQQPGFPPPFGVPPPPGMAGAPPPYGAPPQPYGAQPPMQGAVGPGGQALIPYPQVPSPMVGTLKSQGAAVTGPTRRNALLTLLLPLAVMFGGVIVSILLGVLISGSLAALGMLFVLGGAVWSFLLAIQMIRELQAVTRSDQLAWWGLIVPVYNIYFMWFVVPEEVAKAKQQLGARQPPQSIMFYILLWPFALASDLNDLVR
jgi:zinc-ribbon domain